LFTILFVQDKNCTLEVDHPVTFEVKVKFMNLVKHHETWHQHDQYEEFEDTKAVIRIGIS
jgi:hypothetical protein